MDIFAHLKKDHDKITLLMDDVDAAADERARQALFREIEAAWITHTKAEEASFYDRLSTFPAARVLVDTARADHEKIMLLMDEIHELDPSSDEWITHFRDLKDCVTDHIAEEESHMFDVARSLWGGRESERLERQMRQVEHGIHADERR